MTSPTRNASDVADFISESLTYLDEIEPKLAVLKNDPDSASQEQIAVFFRAFHSIKGVSGFLHFDRIQTLTHRAEEVLDRLRSGKQTLTSEIVTLILSVSDHLRGQLHGIRDSGEDLENHDQFNHLMEALQASLGARQDRDQDRGYAPVENNDGEIKCIFEVFLDKKNMDLATAQAKDVMSKLEALLIELFGDPENVNPVKLIYQYIAILNYNMGFLGHLRISSVCNSVMKYLNSLRNVDGSLKTGPDLPLLASSFKMLTSLIEDEKSLSEEAQTELITELGKTIQTAMRTSSKHVPTAGTAIVPAPPAAGEIRVGLDKLDHLIGLIEELSMVASGISKGVITEEPISRAQEGQLVHVTEALQELAIAVRQVPAGQILRKLVRVVSDVSEKLGKSVRLQILGEEIEMDREVLDALHDPLVHIVRNALDHGLENPSEREQSGKNKTGELKIETWHGNGEFCVSVADDGRGVNREKVLSRALAKGLVNEEARNWPDARVYEILLLPGFSTAEAVTEFSGRGVGMDVVAKTVEKLRGRIEIESKPGQGTRLLVRVPMANALTESLIVAIGSLRYILRISSIRETFYPGPKQLISLPNGLEKVKLRDSLYPVIRLPHSERARTRKDNLMILIENRGHRIALAIDEVIGKIQGVIKSKPAFLRASRFVAGYAIIGTGSDDIAWALDLDRLATEEEHRFPAKVAP